MPLHHQVYRDLHVALAAGDWQPGEQLPTERELADQYGCSLITVRRALDELAREGRLQRMRGRGTFVTEPPILRNITGQMGFADEVRARGYEPYTVVTEARAERASPAVAAALRIQPDASVHYLERVRGADGVPLLLEQVRLPADRLPGLLDHDFAVESLWEVLEASFGLHIGRQQEVLSAVVPSARESQLLGLQARRPSIQLEGTAFTIQGEPMEFSRTLVSPERARYFVESTGSRIRSVTPVARRTHPIPIPGKST